MLTTSYWHLKLAQTTERAWSVHGAGSGGGVGWDGMGDVKISFLFTICLFYVKLSDKNFII